MFSSYMLLGLLAITVLAVALVSLRKEALTGTPVAGLLPLTLIIVTLCAFIALLTVYVRFQRAQAITLRFDRVAVLSEP